MIYYPTTIYQNDSNHDKKIIRIDMLHEEMIDGVYQITFYFTEGRVNFQGGMFIYNSFNDTLNKYLMRMRNSIFDKSNKDDVLILIEQYIGCVRVQNKYTTMRVENQIYDYIEQDENEWKELINEMDIFKKSILYNEVFSQ